MMYSFAINLRVRPGSKKEAMLLDIAQEYGVQPGCHLLWRMIEDRERLIRFRAQEKADALKEKQDAEAKLRRLVAGE